MSDEDGSMESLLSGAGVTVAAAVVMLAMLALFRSTGPADAAIALQTAAADICGDIGTVAVSAIPCTRNWTGYQQGISIRITSDFVIVTGSQGTEFARPLTMRIFPGNYTGAGGACWNDTAGMREYFNATFGQPGTSESPLSPDNGSLALALLEKASHDMCINPVCADQSMPLTIEKSFLYVYNASSAVTEREPYVFVY